MNKTRFAGRRKQRQAARRLEAARDHLSQTVAEFARQVALSLPAGYEMTPDDLRKLESAAVESIEQTMMRDFQAEGFSRAALQCVVPGLAEMTKRELHGQLLLQAPISKLSPEGHA